MDVPIVPNHVVIIPDGNRRWAKEQGKPFYAGHEEGVLRGKELARYARSRGIQTLTYWGLSTDNWVKRSPEECAKLIFIISRTLDEFFADADREGVRFVHLGSKERLPEQLVEKIVKLEESTRNNSRYILNIGIDYGGRDEIIRTTKKIVDKVATGQLKKEEITEELFGTFLDTGNQPFPDPDIVIRTSGEMRTSGMLPWQAGYAELYFEPSMFPDFTVEKFETILQSFASRERRFGK